MTGFDVPGGMGELLTASASTQDVVNRAAPLVKLPGLAPCPFCGGAAAIGHLQVEKVTGTGARSGVFHGWSFVWCRNCLARGPHFDDEARARRAWNGEGGR